MKDYLIFILVVFIQSTGFSQIGEKLADQTIKYQNTFADNIDSIRTIKCNSKLVYSSDDLFKCIHLESKTKEVFQVDLKEKEDFSGYIRYLNDTDSSVFF